MNKEKKNKVKRDFLGASVLLGTLFLIIFQIKRYLKKDVDDATQVKLAHEDTKSSPKISNAKKGHLIQISKDLSHHLGTRYSWYSLKRLTENDKEAYLLLRHLDKSEFDYVADRYKKHFTDGRDLSTDLKKFLDNKYYSQLTFK